MSLCDELIDVIDADHAAKIKAAKHLPGYQAIPGCPAGQPGAPTKIRRPDFGRARRAPQTDGAGGARATAASDHRPHGETAMTQIKNLTPHAITLVAGETQVTIQPSGTVARVSTVAGSKLESSLPVELWSASTLGEVVDLPVQEDGVILLVSSLVAGAAKRADVYSPGTGPNDEAVRNEKGHVVGVTRLVRST